MFPRCLTFLLAAGAAFSTVPGHAAPRPGIGGEYTAAINGGTFDTSGKFRLVLTRSGLGSVSLIAGDEPPCVVGVGYDWETGGLIPRGGDPDMAVHLTLIPNPDGTFTVKGDLEDDGKVFPIEATQAATASGDAPGAHTFVLGTTATKTDLGSGTARVARNGRVTGVVHVGQHKPVSFGGRLTPDQKLPLAVRFGSSESSLTTDLTFGDGRTNGAATVHDEDISTQGFFRRANYVPRAKPVLPLQNAIDSRYTVLAALVDGQPGGYVNQLKNGRFTEVLFHGKPGFLRVARATGVVTGGTDEQTFRGVALQDDNILAGVCNGTLEFNLSNLPGPPFTGTYAGDLTKTGSGTLILTGDNTYTGTTTVDPGTLLTGSASAADSSMSAGSISIGADSVAFGSVTLTLAHGDLFTPTMVIPERPLVLNPDYLVVIPGTNFIHYTPPGADQTFNLTAEQIAVLAANPTAVPIHPIDSGTIVLNSTNLSIPADRLLEPPPGYLISAGSLVLGSAYFSVVPGEAISLTGMTIQTSVSTVPADSSAP